MTTRSFSFFLCLLLFSLSGKSVNAQSGIISGTVKDDQGEALVGATVLIQGTFVGTTTDFDGNYTLKTSSLGQAKLVCSFISYQPSVKTVTVVDGKVAQLDFILSEASIALNEVQVTARANRESENILLLEQKKAIVASQTIGAQELSRKGISNAEGAVTKIAGISKQEGVKNVFVRGLGDRYNTTTLNGFALPSEDPEYKNISLDFFSNDMIQAVNVSKVFTASMNGDVGGALIDIRSKELTSDNEFEIGLSSGFRNQVLGTNFLLPDGMNKFGYANASFGPYDDKTSYAFNTNLDPIQSSAPYKSNFSVSWGRKFSNNHRLFLVGAFGNDYLFQQGVSREITATGAENPFKDMTYTRSIRNASHLFMGNLELDISNQKLSFTTLYLHAGFSSVSDSYGRHTETFQIAEDFNSEGLERRLQINDNTIIVNQLIWNGKISDRLSYNAGASLNHVIGKEPDRRIFRFPSIGNGMVQLAVAESRNQRFNSEISETAIIPKLNLQYKLSDEKDNFSYIELGYDSRISHKAFSAPFYNHVWNPLTTIPTFDLNQVALDPYFNNETFSTNLFKMEFFNDTYNVLKNMHGAYVDLVYHLGSRLTVNAGLRADYLFTKIDYEVNRGASIGTDTINGIFVSPSFNLRYVLNDKNHFRMGSSRTFTLPQDKEISPFVYLGFDGNDNGNPNLEISTNYNFDIKWDYYISNNELFSINGFYKYILKPIARVDQGNSAGLKTFDNVADYAVAAGLEVEIRKKIISIANKHTVNLGLNTSYIYSKINLDPVWFVQNTSSTLEGAAPYIANVDLTHNLTLDNFSIISALVLNYMSDKVHTIGTRGYNNLIEESITTLDFVSSLRINKNFGINLKARNLLNPESKLTRMAADNSTFPSVVIRSYRKGVNFDLGFTYKF